MLNSNNPGKLELPWFMASDSIVSARYEYTDANGERKKVTISNMSSGLMTFSIIFNALLTIALYVGVFYKLKTQKY
jgi:hypothetical protein